MDIPLGKFVPQPKAYAPEVLAAIPRSLGREKSGIDGLNFLGLDRWTAYEFCWFDASGRAHAAILDIQISCTSHNLVESKSLKLYLNSCYYRKFDSAAALQSELQHCLYEVLQGEVRLRVLSLDDVNTELAVCNALGESIDADQPSIYPEYQGKTLELSIDPTLGSIHEKLYSNLFRSLCPVTRQPDWATILIEYRGKPLNRTALSSYLCGYAEHNSFHEACVESIYGDIRALDGIDDVAVCAKFLRRGGIDICPFRTSTEAFEEPRMRLIRQ